MNQFKYISQLFWLLCVVLGGALLGNLLGLVLCTILSEASLNDIMGILQDPASDPRAKFMLLTIQFSTAIFVFIIFPLLYLITIVKKENYVPRFTQVNIQQVLFVIVITFSGIAFNSILIEWNQSLVLPEFMSGIEEWMKNKETELAELTKILTDFSDIPSLMVGLLIIALIPGFGEEFLFRGIVQKIFLKWLNNYHAAILISAFLFSFMHMQFYGFVPRMFLGIVFGYIYYFGKSLWLPALAHFLNNAFSLVLIFLNKNGYIDADVESTESIAWYYVLLGLIIMLASFYLFIKNNPANEQPLEKDI